MALPSSLGALEAACIDPDAARSHRRRKT